MKDNAYLPLNEISVLNIDFILSKVLNTIPKNEVYITKDINRFVFDTNYLNKLNLVLIDGNIVPIIKLATYDFKLVKEDERYILLCENREQYDFLNNLLS